MTEIDQLTCFGTIFPDSLLSRGKELSKVPPSCDQLVQCLYGRV